MVWPLPPIKWWISTYCKSLISSMEKLAKIEFFAYDVMYPKILYPWWDYKNSSIKKPFLSNSEVHEWINWYNPLSWIRAWRSITGEVLHIQYWIRFLFPIVLTINLIARYSKKIPVIVTIHNVLPHEMSFWKIRMDKLVYKSASWFIVHSTKNKEDLIKLIWDQKPIQVIPMGILPMSAKKISKHEARTQLSLSNKKKILLFAGNIRAYKWLWITLDILKALVDIDQEYILIIAGKCWEDRSIYQNQIDVLWLWDYVIRMPWFISEIEMNQVFCASDIQLLTYTHFDAQSAALATWLDFNIPMIVSDLGWLTDVIQDRRFIIDIKNVLESADQIKSVMLDLENSIWYIIERKKEFSWDEITKKTIKFYSDGIS